MNNKLLDTIIAGEQEFLEQEFLAPVFNSKVKVRILGVVHTFEVYPRKFEGFGIFKPLDYAVAKVVREATLSEKQRYLELYPKLHFVVCSQERNTACLFINDGRFKISGEIPILFPQNFQLFDIIEVRFDGNNFWYERHSSRDRVLSLNTRDIFHRSQSLRIPANIIKRFREAYNIALEDKKRLYVESTEGKLKSAVERGNGRFLGYTERDSGYSVEYEIDGHRYTSSINKDLRVVTAGICLSGHDRDFDLQSLMSVVREGQNRHLIHRW